MSSSAELEGVHRRRGAGCEPSPPALLCMISLLQASTSTPDAEAAELTVTLHAGRSARRPSVDLRRAAANTKPRDDAEAQVGPMTALSRGSVF